LSRAGGFYRAIQSSGHPEFGPRYGGSFLQPAGAMTSLLPILASGQRKQVRDDSYQNPTIADPDDERRATRRLIALLDDDTPDYAQDLTLRATPAENDAIEAHLAGFYADPPSSRSIPTTSASACHARAARSVPPVTRSHLPRRALARALTGRRSMCITLLDIDAAHADFNGYLIGQSIADACCATCGR